MLNPFLFTQGEALPHLQLSPSGGKGREREKLLSKCIHLHNYVLRLTLLSCFWTGPAYIPAYPNRGNKKSIFILWFFFPPTWIQLLELRSYAWSLKGEIDCFCGLSQFHIYGGISPYYSCWRPTCLHCSELTLRDSAPTVSHQQILPKAGKRHQAKDNIHSQLMNAKIKKTYQTNSL